jgi:phospholipase/carboxylesterase
MAERAREHGAGRLTVRPGPPPARAGLAPGLHELGGTGQDQALLLVPDGAAAAPLPLAVMLHGAGGDAARGLEPLRAQAGRPLALLSVASRGSTWDVIGRGFGPDVAAVDHALAEALAVLPVDPKRLAICGFSDGASYALSLGLTNGDLFTHVIAFSPGFAALGERHGRPPVFVTHGTEDHVLPVDRCSRRLVPWLRDAGHEVIYREFAGGHEVPLALAAEAADRFAGS